MKKSFVLFIVVVALVFPDLNWHGIDLVVTYGAKKDGVALIHHISHHLFTYENPAIC